MNSTFCFRIKVRFSIFLKDLLSLLELYTPCFEFRKTTAVLIRLEYLVLSCFVCFDSCCLFNRESDDVLNFTTSIFFSDIWEIPAWNERLFLWNVNYLCARSSTLGWLPTEYDHGTFFASVGLAISFHDTGKLFFSYILT